MNDDTSLFTEDYEIAKEIIDAIEAKYGLWFMVIYSYSIIIR